MNQYNEEYYKTGNYLGYMERKKRYSFIAKELNMFLDTISLADKNLKILDYGCGPGFLISSLNEYNYDVCGYDISDWATKTSISYGNKMILTKDLSTKFDIVISLDVFEHMSEDNLHSLFQILNTKWLIVRIPVSINDNDEFYLEVSRQDKTHITCHNKIWWNYLFSKFGFFELFRFNLISIYDSEGVYCSMFMNKNYDKEIKI